MGGKDYFLKRNGEKNHRVGGSGEGDGTSLCGASLSGPAISFAISMPTLGTIPEQLMHLGLPDLHYCTARSQAFRYAEKEEGGKRLTLFLWC